MSGNCLSELVLGHRVEYSSGSNRDSGRRNIAKMFKTQPTKEPIRGFVADRTGFPTKSLEAAWVVMMLVATVTPKADVAKTSK
jgi:hypothetical protein